MALLSSQLQTVLDALPLQYQTLSAAGQYRKIIAEKANELDKYTEETSNLPKPTNHASTTT